MIEKVQHQWIDALMPRLLKLMERFWAIFNLCFLLIISLQNPVVSYRIIYMIFFLSFVICFQAIFYFFYRYFVTTKILNNNYDE